MGPPAPAEGSVAKRPRLDAAAAALVHGMPQSRTVRPAAVQAASAGSPDPDASPAASSSLKSARRLRLDMASSRAERAARAGELLHVLRMRQVQWVLQEQQQASAASSLQQALASLSSCSQVVGPGLLPAGSTATAPVAKVQQAAFARSLASLCLNAAPVLFGVNASDSSNSSSRAATAVTGTHTKTAPSIQRSAAPNAAGARIPCKSPSGRASSSSTGGQPGVAAPPSPVAPAVPTRPTATAPPPPAAAAAAARPGQDSGTKLVSYGGWRQWASDCSGH
jgi:hypothetical protein